METWLSLAIEAREKLHHMEAGRGKGIEGVPKQGRLAQIAQCARSYGLAPATLRNYLIALDAYESIPDPDLRAILANHSAVTASAFGRWYKRDQRAASNFLLEHPHATMRMFLSAERQAREHRSGARRRPRLEDLTKYMIPQTPTLVHRSVPGSGGIIDFQSRNDCSPSFRFAGLNFLVELDMDWGHTENAGVVVVPRYQSMDSYDQVTRRLWQRAVTAAVLCPFVLIIFPGPAARRRFLINLPDPPPLDPTLGDFSVGSHPINPRIKIGERSSPIYFWPSRSLGVIVATTLLSIRRDLEFWHP